jgi:hypothetical protein
VGNGLFDFLEPIYQICEAFKGIRKPDHSKSNKSPAGNANLSFIVDAGSINPGEKVLK